MSGKRHHIVPRLLQKGFASRIQGKTVLTWLYNKKTGVSKTDLSTKDIMVSENFYGKKGSLNVDDEITNIEEKKLTPLINSLRNMGCNFAESRNEIAELIAHFSIRTKFIRKSFETASSKMLKGIRDIATDEHTIENVFLNPPPTFIKEQADVFLSDPKNKEFLEPALQIFELFGITKNQVGDLLSEITSSELKNEETKDEFKKIIQGQFADAIDKSCDLIPNSIREGHIKSLSKNAIPLTRVEKYKQLNWNVYEVESPLILGDVACIFREEGDNLFKSSCDIDKTGQIYLPISSNQILIGTLESEEIETSVKILNESTAKCSYEQFICSEKTQDKIGLIELIGINSYLASDEEIEFELDDIRNNLEKIIFEKGS